MRKKTGKPPKAWFKPGNTLAVSGYDGLNMAVFNLNVFDWNGALPYLAEEQDIISKYDTDASRDKALLVNGDVLRGSHFPPGKTAPSASSRTTMT